MIAQETALRLALRHHPSARPLRPGAPPAQAHLFRAGDLLVKVYAPEARDRALRQAARQSEAAALMTAGPHRVPPVNGVIADSGLLSMPWIEGADLARLYRAHPGPEHAQRAGAWLARFHALSARKWPFRPAGQVNWLNRLVAAGTQGDRHIPDLPGFTAAVRRTQAQAPRTRGQPARKAVTHRDMTLSNLLWDGGIVWGIDLENTLEDEPLRDVFTLALDLMSLAAMPGDPAANQADRAVAALVTAYADRHTARPVRLFLQRCFCLWVWANTPASPAQRHRIRLAIAQDLLAHDRLIL